MKLLIFGASGPLGRAITQAALAAGHQVTAFVRTPGRLGSQPGLREVSGDVLDAGPVVAAVPGHDLHPGTGYIIAAMKATGVSRLIWISSHGVGDARGHSGFLFERIFVPWRLRAEFTDKERQEALVTATDLDWTIIRPARLTNGPATRRLQAQPRLPVTIRDSISRADVAQFVLGELKTGTHLLTAPTIAAT